MFERELKTQASHGTSSLSILDCLIAWQYASITERIFRLTTPLEGGLFTTLNFAPSFLCAKPKHLTRVRWTQAGLPSKSRYSSFLSLENIT